MLITNISTIIDNILSQNKLIPEIGTNEFFSIPKNHLRRFYVTSCKTQENKKVFLKVLINDNPEDQKTIISEIKLYQYLEDQAFKSFRVPHIYANGQELPAWYQREYIEYGTIADMHFILEQSIKGIEVYSQIAVKALSEMANFMPSEKSEITPPPTDYFFKRIEEYDKYVSKYIPNFKNLAMEKHREILANSDDKKILVHGDYHLENLFFEKDGLVIVDWERVHIGKASEDFSSLWVSLWQVPEIQAKALESFYQNLPEDQKKSFDKNIDSMIFVQAAKEFQHWIYCKDTHRNERYTVKTVDEGFNYFRHILTSLLDDSFKLNEVT